MGRHESLADILVEAAKNKVKERPATRGEILDDAKEIVCDGRPQEYGGPEDSFARIAALWSAYTGHEYTAHDVAMMMALLKIARTKGGKYNPDNYIDMAGYAACAGEIGGKG